MKKITLKNQEIVAIILMLNDKDSLLNSSSPDKKIPIAILWKIDENYRKLNAIYEKIIKLQEKIISNYRDDAHSEEITDENGNKNRIVKPEYMKQFNAEISELMNLENDLDISTVAITDIEHFVSSGRDFQSIRFMLENGESAEPHTIEQ